jgi:hypothetical protein
MGPRRVHLTPLTSHNPIGIRSKQSHNGSAALPRVHVRLLVLHWYSSAAAERLVSWFWFLSCLHIPRKDRPILSAF